MSSQRRPKQEKLKQKEAIIMKTKLIKMITSCSLFGCALVSLVAAMALGTPGIARADSRGASCGVETLRGSYMFPTHGGEIFWGGGGTKKPSKKDLFKEGGAHRHPLHHVTNNR